MTPPSRNSSKSQSNTPSSTASTPASSSSGIGTESAALLLANATKEQEKRDGYVVDAALSLNYVVLIFAWTSIFALILVMINEYTNDAIPIWAVFLVLWLGHMALFIVTVQIVRLVLRSLLAKNDAERMTQKWHQANEKRIPLIQFVMYHLLWIFGASFILVLVELMVFLYDYGLVPAYAFLVPIYIMSGIALSNSLVCRSTAVIAIMSWALLFIFAVLYNVRLNDSNALSWGDVFVPLFLLIGNWIAVTVYVWVQYLRNVYRLKVFQMESLALYFLAFSSFFISLYAYTLDLQSEEAFGNISDVKFSTAVALFGACAFFAALSISMDAILQSAIARMGGDRPKPLVQLEQGGWDFDHQRSFENFIIIGDVESPESQQTTVGTEEKSCGCCASTLEMISGSSRRYRAGFFNDQNASDGDDEEALMASNFRDSR